MRYMENPVKILISLILVSAALGLLYTPARFAATEGSEFPFMAEPVYPDKQVEPNAGYWYVDAVKGKTQEFKANVKNTGSQEITVAVEPADCYTSTGGDLCYITDNTSPLVGLTDDRFMLAGEISLPVKDLKLKPGEAVQVAFSVKAPDIDEGEVLGGIRFSVTQQGRSAGMAPAGGDTQLNLNIKNAITITIRLRYKTPLSIPVPGFSIGDAGFEADSGTLYFTLSNLLPVINRDVRGSYDVYDERSNRLFGGVFDMVRMAPESEVRFPVKWNYPKAEPGTYRVSVLPENASAPEIRTIRLGSGDVEIIGSESPPAAAPQGPGTAAGNKFLIYGGWILFGVTFIFFIIFMFIRRRKREN